MTKVNISNQKMTGLYSVLKSLSQSTLPMKFTIARNLKAIEPLFEAYTEAKDVIHKKYVLVDEKGDNAIKQQYQSLLDKAPVVPYNWFEYESEEGEKKFFDELQELNDVCVDINLQQEDLKRKVKVKLVGEKSESYETLTLEEVLEDPSTQINGDALSVLLEYEILK